MLDFIQTVRAPENAGPFNWFMHPPSGGPGSTDGFQPTHSQERTYPFEKLLNFREPIILHANYSKLLNSERDKTLIYNSSTQICARLIMRQNLTNSRLNAFVASRQRRNREINQPTMLWEPISNSDKTVQRSFQSKGIMQGLQIQGLSIPPEGKINPKELRGALPPI